MEQPYWISGSSEGIDMSLDPPSPSVTDSWVGLSYDASLVRAIEKKDAFCLSVIFQMMNSDKLIWPGHPVRFGTLRNRDSFNVLTCANSSIGADRLRRVDFCLADNCHS